MHLFSCLLMHDGGVISSEECMELMTLKLEINSGKKKKKKVLLYTTQQLLVLPSFDKDRIESIVLSGTGKPHLKGPLGRKAPSNFGAITHR